MEANLNGMDATSMIVDLMEDDLHGRQSPRQTTSAEDDFKGREAQSKMPWKEDKIIKEEEQTVDQYQGTESRLMTMNRIYQFFQVTTFSKLKYS